MDRLLSLMLVELDGALRPDGPPLLLLGATRDPRDLDPAILRPGRLDVHVCNHICKPHL
jgi:SpoVK/Ycf46/Vps4 family AAA+-type ATPase